ncbi:MAG: response regulator [Acidobacteria bacterium]|nr:response regulator [Acidobacteriota bacterium]
MDTEPNSIDALLQAATLRWRYESAARGIYTTDARLNIRTWNSWLEKYTHRTAQEMIGRHLFEAFPELVERHFDKYYAEVLQGHPTVVAEKFHTCLLDMPAEGRTTRRMRQSANIAPLFHEDQVIGTLTIIDDVTERVFREAELQEQVTRAHELLEELRLSEERLILAMEAAHAGSFDWNVVTNETFWSGECYRIFGVDPVGGNITYEEWFSRIHPEDRERVTAAIDKALADTHSVELEHRVVRPDGSIRWVSGMSRTAFGPQRRPLRVTGIMMDITKHKLAEAERERLLASERHARLEAEEASRLKDEFLATVSHELRTPLNAILGWAYMLRNSHLDELGMQRALESIDRNANMQARLVEDLLDVSRIISGKMALDVRTVNLATVIEAAVETLTLAANAKQITLDVSVETGLCMVLGDQTRLQQVVWNLLSNAIKFTPTGGRVQVAVKCVDPKIEITVSDTGQGIRAELLPYVFDRFRQGDGSTTRAQGGLGLGLAIVRHLVELHGGDVGASSPGEGMGTTVRVRLPVLRSSAMLPITDGSKAAQELVDASENAAWVPNIEGLHVLVVDDESETRLLARSILEQFKATVTTADSAAEALELVQQVRPDVLVADIGLPHEDGYSLISKVRELPPDKGGEIPAAALTAYARPEDRTKALRAGFQLHIPKPLQPTRLVIAVQYLAGLVRQTRV